VRRRAATTLLLALATGLAPGPARAAACGRPAAAKAGRWYVAAPPLPAHSAAYQQLHGDLRRLRAVAVAPGDPRVVLATDGERVQRSDDGGCSWRQVFAVPDPAADAASDPAAAGATPSRDLDEITSIDVGPRGRTLLAVEPTGYGPRAGGRTYLYLSPDGRTGWTSVGDATLLASVDDPFAGASSPMVRSGAGGVAYVAFVSRGTVAYLRSGDGRTWTRQTAAAAPGDPVAIGGFAVSPWNADELWEWGGTQSQARDTLTGLRHSTDGAKTWTAVNPWPFFGANPPTWHSADVAWPRRGAPARLLVLGATRDPTTPEGPPALAWSGDGGRTFVQAVPPDRTSVVDAAVVHTATGDAVLVAASGVTYVVPYRGRLPRATDWRTLPAPPVKPDAEWTGMGYDRARASATAPGVVVLPTWAKVELLTVGR
jgi:hypothetical protein